MRRKSHATDLSSEEIVKDMAPGAELFLATTSTTAETQAAIEWFVQDAACRPETAEIIRGSRSGELGGVKPGIGRIALESGAPVVPVAIQGSEGVRRWKRFRFPKVTVEFGEPIKFPAEEAPSRERQLEVAERIFAPVREMYAGLSG